MSRIDARYETRYSVLFPGNKWNHERKVRFDYSPRGYIGISAQEPDGTWTDRVLLSPEQMKALKKFVENRGY